MTYSADKWIIVVTEYGFCVDFVTCVQCALKSHVSPQCGDGIEFKNSNQTSTYR